LPLGELRNCVKRCVSVRDCRATKTRELRTLTGKLTFAAEAHQWQGAGNRESSRRGITDALEAHPAAASDQLDVVGDASGTIKYGASEASLRQFFGSTWPKGIETEVAEGDEQDFSTLREIIGVLVAVQTSKISQLCAR